MRNLIYIIIFSISILILQSCEPIEDRMELGSAITADQLDISATLLVVNGKNSNKVIVNNNSPVLSSWDYGTGLTQKKTDTVLLVAKGENEIIFTGLNADGTKINKSLMVNVEELTFPVPLEWGMLTGGKDKEWVWDTTKPAVWGNGGYMGNDGPAWWTLKESDINGQAPGEGTGAKMIFSLRGAKLSKVKSDGKTETGSFSFDMTKKITLDNGTVWAKGKLTTKGVTVLCGKSPNEGGAPVYEYDILIINDNEIVLSYPEPGVGPWGTAWFWNFKAK